MSAEKPGPAGSRMVHVRYEDLANPTMDTAMGHLVARKAGDAELDPEAAYRDDTWEERECDRCGRLYRGPAVYCSFVCAVRDA